MCGYYGFPPLIIIYSRDHGYNSYVKFQLALQNSINSTINIAIGKRWVSISLSVNFRFSEKRPLRNGYRSFDMFYLTNLLV